MNVINDPKIREESLSKIKVYLSKLIKLTDLDWEVFTSGLDVVEYKKNEYLLNQGDIENHMYCLTSGIVRKFTESENKEYTLEFKFPINFFCSYISFITKQPSLTSLQALSTSYLVRITGNDMEKLYSKAPNAHEIGRKMIEFAYIEREMKDIKQNSQDALQNYKDLLQNNPNLIKEIPQKHIASYLGINPETLSRLKNKLEQ